LLFNTEATVSGYEDGLGGVHRQTDMGQQRALVVGVSNYPPPIPSLPGVANDAKAMADLLGSQQGQFRGGDVTVLTDAQANGAAIRAQLDAVLNKASWDDTVFVYVAGHGKVHNGAYYFVAHDTDRGRVAETGVPLADLRAMFDTSQSRRVFVWLDFCHSGGVIERDLTDGEADAQAVIERTLKVVGRGKIIVTACTALQTAKESKALGHGFFTHALLEGLRGAAADNKGRVLATTLYTHVVDRLQAESHDQSPVWHGQMEGNIILMHYPDRGTAQNTPSRPGGGVCDSSGDWVMVGNLFLPSVSVTVQPDKVVIEVKPRSTAEYAAIQQLAPKHRRGDTIPFAHGDDALIARVSDITSRSAAGQQMVTITLTPENVQFGGHGMEWSAQDHSADEIAEKRAGRLLLNDPPVPPKSRGYGIESFVESFVRGDSNSRYPAERAVLQEVHASLKGGADPLLPLARLRLLYALKASDCVEQVLDLRLGPVKDGKCHVRFQGRRARRYTNVEPHVITVEGDCPLE
jgi:hypothetical protein